METLKKIGIATAVLVFGVLVVSKLSHHWAERSKQQAVERHTALMQAVRQGDAPAIQKLGSGFIDIYATDSSGESPVSLAEKSGQAPLLDALKKWRNPQKDLWRAQNAAETGTSIGLQPTQEGPELNIHNLVSAEQQRARSEGRPVPQIGELTTFIEDKINALPEGNRKEWARRNFAMKLAEGKLFDQARAVVLQLKDPKMAADALIYMGQGVPSGPELQSHLSQTRHLIDMQIDDADRDPYYAQLAHVQWLRGDTAGAQSSCMAIRDAQYKTATCNRL